MLVGAQVVELQVTDVSIIDTHGNFWFADGQSADEVRPRHTADDGDQTEAAGHGGHQDPVNSTTNPAGPAELQLCCQGLTAFLFSDVHCLNIV